jgi:hypothetical protein
MFLFLVLHCHNSSLLLRNNDTRHIDYEFKTNELTYHYAMGLIAKPPEKTMKLSNGKYALDLSVDEDTYWGLLS